MKQTTKIWCAIGISTAFFIVEIVLGFRQRSLALVADAFHVASDIIGFVVALVARYLADRKTGLPIGFSYGLQRGPILGAFFNGCFLGGLGFSIVLQAIERLIFPEEVRDPKLVLIVGAVGLGLNILSALVVHEHGEHGHSHGHGHAHSNGSGRTTPATTLNEPDAESGKGLAIPMVRLSSVNSARLLLEAAPEEMDLPGMERDIMRVKGIKGVHEMHVFSLTQKKHIASLHVVVSPEQTMSSFMDVVKQLRECLHAWGLHGGVTIQPELATLSRSVTPEIAGTSSSHQTEEVGATSTAVNASSHADNSAANLRASIAIVEVVRVRK
ncbi:cation efflux protein [Cystobasidium minutum MCA 4210]|uniref:cation efflux protein n=1 Tax=Cystobasidium minutum MCA 4210 TaxID=1397322 RepID=UPI0034CECBE6|eukprot:jgi/Rhomi1/181809/fgenesh1_pg.8_\